MTDTTPVIRVDMKSAWSAVRCFLAEQMCKSQVLESIIDVMRLLGKMALSNKGLK